MGNKRIYLVGIACALTIASIASYHLYGLKPSEITMAKSLASRINHTVGDVGKINAFPDIARLRVLIENNELKQAVSNTLTTADPAAVKADASATAKVAALAGSGIPGIAGAAQGLEQKMKGEQKGETDADKVKKIIKTENNQNLTGWFNEIRNHLTQIETKRNYLETVLQGKEPGEAAAFKAKNNDMTDQIEQLVNDYTDRLTNLQQDLVNLKANNYQLDQDHKNEAIKSENDANNFVGSVQTTVNNIKNDLKIADIEALITEAKAETWQEIKTKAEATAQQALNTADGKGYKGGDPVYDNAQTALYDAQAANDLQSANDAKTAADNAKTAADNAPNKGPKKSLAQLQQDTADVQGKSQQEKDAVLAEVQAQIDDLESQNIYDGPDYDALDKLKQQLVVKFS